MSNTSNIPISHYKVLSLPSILEPNSVYYVLDQNTFIVEGYITSKYGVPIPLFNGTGDTVNSVTGTGVTGTTLNPKVNIATFVSSQLGNRVKLSTLDGKLQVNPITSPNSSIEVVATSTELQIQLSEAIAEIIDSAIQAGDNISELVNDVGYITLADVPNTTSILKISAENIPSYTPVAIYNNQAYKLDNLNPLHQFAFVGFSTNGTATGQTCIIQQIGELTLNGWGLTPNAHYLAGNSGVIQTDNLGVGFTKIIGYATTADTLQILKDTVTINK